MADSRDFTGARDAGGRDDRLLSWRQVQRIAGISRSTAWRLEREGGFPARVRVSPGRVGWWESELDQWKRSRSGRLPSSPRKPARVPRLPGTARPTPPLGPEKRPLPDAPAAGSEGATDGRGGRRTGAGWAWKRRRTRVPTRQMDFGF